MKRKYLTSLIFILVFVVGLSIGLYNNTLYKSKMYYTASNFLNRDEFYVEDRVDPKYIFRLVKVIIDRNYVEKIDDKLYNEMSIDLAKGMLRELGDSNCKFIDEKEMAMLDNATKGEFEGVGIRTNIKNVDVNGISEEKLYVASVIPGGAAWRSGIKAGDMIISVNDKEILPYNPLNRIEKLLKDFQLNYHKSKIKDVQKQIDDEYDRVQKGISIFDAERLLSFKDDKTVKVKTNRGEYKLVTSSWKLSSAKKIVYDNTPYIHIQYIGKDTGELVGKYLKESKNNRSIVLDLRDVFGGNYEDCVELAKWFVPNTNIGMLKTKDSEIILQVPENKDPWKGQTIILVNKGTCKYGELLANSIGRNKSSVILGENTLGDLKDISVYSLNNNCGFTLTTGEYILKNKAKNVVANVKINPGINGKKIDGKDMQKALIFLGGKK